MAAVLQQEVLQLAYANATEMEMLEMVLWQKKVLHQFAWMC